MNEGSVIIIGAGIAGLAAAYELAQAGVMSTVLEARERIGGRIYTTPAVDAPVELGAEFVHGKDPGLWELIERVHASSKEVADRHRICRESKLIEMTGFWEDFERIVKRIDPQRRDQPLAEFLIGLRDVSPYRKQMVIDFVEGFDAADARRISVHSLAADEERSEQIEGNRSFRLANGYGALVEWLARELESKNVHVHCGMKVEEVDWEHEAVTITARDDHGARVFEAPHAIITLPLGVLQAGDVRFDPELTKKRHAIEGLAMGQVVKVILQFHTRFWDAEDFGFVHGCDEWFPTWWSHDHAAMLTGWAGGPSAGRIVGKSREFIIARAVEAVARIFKMSERVVKQEVAAVYFHDWNADPFSRGAYSYIPVGMMAEQRELSEPVEDTLFFAGEAVTLDPQPGTVHSALSSGKHAAQAVLRCRESSRHLAHV